MRIFLAFFSVLTLFGPAVLVASEDGPIAKVLASDDRSFTMRVETPEPRVVAREDGWVDLSVEGFRASEVPGLPSIPTKTYLIAIPPDSRPRLEIRLAGERRFEAVVPAPVPRETLEGQSAFPDTLDPTAKSRESWLTERLEAPRRELREPDPAAYAPSAGLFPAAVASLGGTGILRNQRYVELNVSPVRWDPAEDGIWVDPAFELTVRFEGGQATAYAEESGPFEAVYRNAFLNYEQGRYFRLTPGDGFEAPPKTASAGTTFPIRRISVTSDGLVRLDHTLISSEAPEFLAHSPVNWQLFSHGEQVPLHLRQNGGGNDAVFESGEWVQFVGQAMTGEPRMVLNHPAPGEGSLYEVRDFTDENVYFLTVGAGIQDPITERDATPLNIAPLATSFRHTTRFESDEFFFPVAADDTFYDAPAVTQGTPPRSDEIALPGLADGTADTQFRVAVRGATTCAFVDPDHETRVVLINDNGDPLALPASDPNNVGTENQGSFDGNNAFLHEIAWEHGGGDPVVTDPMDVQLDAIPIGPTCGDGGPAVLNHVYLNWIEIEYERGFEAFDDTLSFEVPDGATEFEITGFDSAQPEVYEITELLGSSIVYDAVRLTGVTATFVPLDSTYTVKFRIDDLGSGAPRRFVVAGDSAVTVPTGASFAADRVSTLLTDTTPADMVVLIHPDVVSSTCSISGGSCSYDVDCASGASDVCEILASGASGKLGSLLARRDVEGISSRVVRIGDVRDEFGFGLAGPDAIKNFAAFLVAGGWSGVQPDYLLILGDGSWDSKATTTFTGNLVPTQILIKASDILTYYSSDNQLTAVAGPDQIPDIVVGRLPARTILEANTMLDKLLEYPDTPGFSSWRSSVLLISDKGKPGADQGAFEASEFKRINDIGGDLLADEPYTVNKINYWDDYCCSGSCSCNPGGAELAIKSVISDSNDGGVILTQFTGHGNFKLWSDDWIFCADDSFFACGGNDDSSDLLNGKRLPWLLVNNCLSGGFHETDQKTFGEQWLKSQLGGAIAVFAPSGLGFRFLGEVVTEEIWGDMFGATRERNIAVPVMDAIVRLCGQSSIQGCQFYTFLGDPSMVLDLPVVDPATSLQATPSTDDPDGYVDLSWNASADAVSYNVYRATGAAGSSYSPIGSSATTTFHDDVVDNTVTYFYYVRAVDTDLFFSAQSNFNSDCGTTELDCVSATPLNTTPPLAPAGLTVADAETGGRLDLTWLPNGEEDFSHYTVHWGTTPALGQTVAAQQFLQFALTGLSDGIPHYVSVTATNTSGFTSQLAPVQQVTPNLILGTKNPAFVTDLRLGRAGVDALLSWSPITTDLYGKPLTVAFYEVFRSTTVQFVPSLATRIGTPVTASFTDTNALAGPAPRYHYLVRAVDAEGNAGGLGHDLPRGIAGLRLGKPSVGQLRLEWPAVALDFANNPTTITSYEVYHSATRFGRADIRDETPGVDLLSSGAATELEIVMPGGVVYYSVLAVDDRGNKSPF